jgi:hypothetical protein
MLYNAWSPLGGLYAEKNCIFASCFSNGGISSQPTNVDVSKMRFEQYGKSSLGLQQLQLAL